MPVHNLFARMKGLPMKFFFVINSEKPTSDPLFTLLPGQMSVSEERVPVMDQGILPVPRGVRAFLF